MLYYTYLYSVLLCKNGVHNTNSAELIVQRNAVFILDGRKSPLEQKGYLICC